MILSLLFFFLIVIRLSCNLHQCQCKEIHFLLKTSVGTENLDIVYIDVNAWTEREYIIDKNFMLNCPKNYQPLCIVMAQAFEI